MPADSVNLGFSFNQQVIEAPASTLVPVLLNLQTRTFVLKYDQRVKRRWANNLEAGLILSREGTLMHR